MPHYFPPVLLQQTVYPTVPPPSSQTSISEQKLSSSKNLFHISSFAVISPVVGHRHPPPQNGQTVSS
jgi:hypothetical protein